MKKSAVILVGALAMLATSCGFKSEEKPLNGSLVTYTAEGTKDGEILLGVKDNSGKELIPAAGYTTITADDNIITCTRSDQNVDIFTLNGEPVSTKTYKSFESRTTADNTYYIGQPAEGETTVYFFPGKEAISCNVSYMSPQNLYMEKKDIWEVYSYDGSLIWNFPTTASVLKSKRPEEIVIAVPTTKGKVTTATLYTPAGKELKKLNAYKWKRLQKKLKEPTKIGTMNLYELETIDVNKL